LGKTTGVIFLYFVRCTPIQAEQSGYTCRSALCRGAVRQQQNTKQQGIDGHKRQRIIRLHAERERRDQPCRRERARTPRTLSLLGSFEISVNYSAFGHIVSYTLGANPTADDRDPPRPWP